MSKLRSLSTAFWSDPFVEELSPSEKLLFIYLITNSKTNMLGIYEATIKKMSFETGINKPDIEKALKGFERLGKVKYKNNYVILVNYLKHQNFNTNMKKSAIDVYNNLPKELKNSEIDIDKSNPLKGFETLCNHFGMVRKIEVEEEREEEVETEYELEYKELLLSEINISDLTQENQNYFNIAISFQELIKENIISLGASTKNIDNTKGKAIDEMRLLITNDGYTIEQAKKVFEYLQNEIPNGNFSWKQNILSIKTLRQKFDKLIIAANGTDKQQNGTTTKKGFDGAELAEMLKDKFS